LSNGDGTFSPAGVIGGGPSFITGTISDINGDGNLDLVANDGVSVFLGNGDGTYSNRAVNFQPAWIDPFIWASPTDQDQLVNGPAVFAVEDFSGTGLPGIAMIVQTAPGGEISLPNPLPAPAPDFLISGGIPTVIAPGGQISFTVKSTPIAGFHADVALSCDGLPAGLTCSFAPAILTAGSGQAILTIAASSSAMAGSYPFSLTGTAGTVSHGQERGITIAAAAGATTAYLRPVSVNFPAQPVGIASAIQQVTLTNAGSATLQVSSVSFGGANAKDFSIYSNNCGVSVAAFTSCQIVVMFSPTASGARAATLTVNDNATGGLQVVSLNGSGADFVIGSVSSSATVAAGKAATYMLTVGGVAEIGDGEPRGGVDGDGYGDDDGGQRL
jgi:hypothetical protein